MDKIEHTPTPWETNDDSYVRAQGGDMIADLSDTSFEPCQDEANAKRIVSCVNACHDIEDPDRAHAVARDAIRTAHDLLDSLECYSADWLDVDMRVYIARRLAHLSEAHALLGGGPL